MEIEPILMNKVSSQRLGGYMTEASFSPGGSVSIAAAAMNDLFAADNAPTQGTSLSAKAE